MGDQTRDRSSKTITAVEPAAPTIRRRGEACVVVLYGPELGRRATIGRGAFQIGRSSKNELPIDQESVSRHHARITPSQSRGFTIEDLGSTNGTYVNHEKLGKERHVLKDGDQIRVGRSILKFMSGTNVEANYHEEIYRLMTVDALTQVYNKRYFGEALEREFNRAHRYKRDLSLVLIDIDFFKDVNDRNGHLAGDALLRQVAAEVKPRLREQDIFARVGGEEFAMLLPEVGVDGAVATAEKVRRIIELADFVLEGGIVKITVSAGVTALDPRGRDPNSLYERADAALYEAKAKGRNRVERG